MRCKILTLLGITLLAVYARAKPVRVIYAGDACECSDRLPFQLEVPLTPIKHQKLYSRGYKIEVPETPAEEVKYVFDFKYEKPIVKQQNVQLGSFGYKVETLPEPQPEVRYNYNYDVEFPINKRVYNKELKGLVASVDRIVLPKSDCPQSESCSCNCYKPRIERLKPCPYHNRDQDLVLHGHPNQIRTLDENSGWPINHSRYESNSVVRTKREVEYKKPVKSESKPFKGLKKRFSEKLREFQKRGKRDSMHFNEDHQVVDSGYESIENLQDYFTPEILQYLPEAESPKYDKKFCYNCHKNTYPYGDTYHIEYSHPGSRIKDEANLDNYHRNNQIRPRYVYDRLGHKYRENKGSYKLMRPEDDSTASKVRNSRQYNGGEGERQYDNWDDFIRQMVHNHPDFIEASDYGVGKLTPPIAAQREQLTDFAQQILEDYWAKIHGDSEEHHHSSYDHDHGASYERFIRSLHRKYHLVPVTPSARDGSFLVKLIPNKHHEQQQESQEKILHEEKLAEVSGEAISEVHSEAENDNRNSLQFLKTVRDGKAFEILTTSSDESFEGDLQTDFQT